MKKNELKDGMVVELRDHKKMLVLKGKLINNDLSYSLEYYRNDLTRTDDTRGIDIVKVFNTKGASFRNIFKEEHLEIIWERKDIKDIETLQKILDKYCTEEECTKKMSCKECFSINIFRHKDEIINLLKGE